MNIQNLKILILKSVMIIFKLFQKHFNTSMPIFCLFVTNIALMLFVMKKKLNKMAADKDKRWKT